MGQTLPNGIYLPAEGERNCYDGLEGNWRSLDSLISTVAGKASATHTHGNITNDGKVGTTANLPLITGASGTITTGSFGTSANTFCEGNDSRLSDARTPVAHTHTKSDVTDLLNSNFIPSANNAYDLGSSSYQWNNLYAKGYYYNGTAWGLDKNNSWSGIQFLSKNSIHVRNVEPGVVPSSEVTAGFRMENANASYSFGDVLCKINTGGTTYINLTASNKFSNGALDPNGTPVGRSLQVGIRSDGSGFIYTDCGWRNNLIPHSLEPNLSLGTSTNKWKTLNGVNPGALSLPDISKYDNVTSQVQPPAGESTINLQGGANTWTASADGYLVYMGRYNHFSQVYLYVAGTYIGAQMSTDANSAPLYRFVSVPVYKNQVVQIQVYGTQFNSVYFYPNLGNV